jgi:hypothetical protein
VLEEKGKTVRPTLEAVKVVPRGISIYLQRKITDFSADTPFHQVPNKLKEHYGFELSPEKIRQTTLKHCLEVKEYLGVVEKLPKERGVKQLICEADGSMLPIVEIDENKAGDKRKARKVCWKEARLCFSRDVNKATGLFRATMGSTEELGNLWFSSAVAAGMGESTEIHALGDGALWIYEQVERVFGSKGAYLVDFYHVGEYLSAASVECCKEEDREAWQDMHKNNLKKGDLYLVLQELERHLWRAKEGELPASMSCYRYLTNRLQQLDYLGAIEEGLPIGSGEIESGHRHVVQKRMKRAGSWWKVSNAEAMLQLLTLRSNGLWEGYWETQRAA